MSKAIQATVIEAISREPIADARVTVTWRVERVTGLGHGDELVEIIEQEAVTDTHGLFQVPGWGPRYIKGRIYDSYPQVTINKAGFVPTVHENYSIPMAKGTACNKQFNRGNRHWWHDSLIIGVTWNNCPLELPRMP